jgi:hypothetical protein
MKTKWNRWMGQARRLTLPQMTVAAAASLLLALGISACENVAGYTQPSLVRVIDASYIAGAINVYVEGTELAANIAQGSITAYGTLPASANAAVLITAATITNPTVSNALVNSAVTLLAGHEHSVLLTDNGAKPTDYTVTVLEDQQIEAASGHSAFRFLNQAAATGPVDIYMIPSGTTIKNTKPLYTNLGTGNSTGYILFNSATYTMEVMPTGTLTPKWTSSALALTGGEVRTVLIVNTQLTNDPPVGVFMATDVD